MREQRHDWEREKQNSTDVMYDEVRQLRAWCVSANLLARPIDVASQQFPLLRGLLIFDSPPSRLDGRGTAVLILPRVSTGRMPKQVKSWALHLRSYHWEVLATRGAENAIERLSAMGYG